MNVEEFRDFCLSLPDVTEATPFEKFSKGRMTILVFYVEGSIRGHVTDGFAPASKFRHLTNSIFAKGSDHIKMRLSAQD